MPFGLLLTAAAVAAGALAWKDWKADEIERWVGEARTYEGSGKAGCGLLRRPPAPHAERSGFPERHRLLTGKLPNRILIQVQIKGFT
jgi:hypothetical protein